MKTIEDFLKAQDDEDSALVAVVDRIHGDSERVRVIPALRSGECRCNDGFAVPRDLIRTIDETGETHVCCGRARRLARVSFAQHEGFDIEAFLKFARSPVASNVGDLATPFALANPKTDATVTYTVASDGTVAYSEKDIQFKSTSGVQGVVLKAKTTYPCGGTANFGEAVQCGTVFLGESTIVIEVHGGADAPVNVGLMGWHPGSTNVVTLHPWSGSSYQTVYKRWFWGTDVTVLHTFVAPNHKAMIAPTVKMHH